MTAQTIFGAMHGLETLTQLVEVQSLQSSSLATIPHAPVQIDDAPRLPFRGLMIDSGRHFLPTSHVKHAIEAAAMVKLNVIHWHLVDSSSFPTCSDAFPLLCQEGAYPNADHPGLPLPAGVPKAVYTPDELKEVVSFAKEHGVQIQPEWDMPGHGSWGMGMPELMTTACRDALGWPRRSRRRWWAPPSPRAPSSSAAV